MRAYLEDIFREVDVSKLEGKDVRLVGFDNGVPNDALRAALRLLGEWPARSGYGNEAYSVEGVLGLLIDGKREDWLLRVDPQDGYRSSLAPIIAAPIEAAVMQFSYAPIPVRIEEVTRVTDPDVDYVRPAEATRLVDASGHVWIEFGTDNVDDYYPSGYVTWTPKAPT